MRTAMLRDRVILSKVFKIAVGCCIAYKTADFLQLQYPASAVTITLLSIQNTRRDTFRLAGKRLCAFLAAIALSWLSFRLAGYTLWGLGLFLLLFAAGCQLGGLTDGLSMSTVLVLHFWGAGRMTLAGTANELALMGIGILMGIVLNLYMPRQIRAIRADQQRIDEGLRRVLYELADRVTHGGGGLSPRQELAALDRLLETARRRADAHRDNSWGADARYYAQYVELRRRQWDVLSAMADDLPRLASVPAQARAVAAFMRQVARSLHEYNNAAALLEELAALRRGFHQSPLPATREEFETRAVLYEIVHQLHGLLELKRAFAASLTPSQVRAFWHGEGRDGTA